MLVLSSAITSCYNCCTDGAAPVPEITDTPSYHATCHENRRVGVSVCHNMGIPAACVKEQGAYHTVYKQALVTLQQIPVYKMSMSNSKAYEGLPPALWSPKRTLTSQDMALLPAIYVCVSVHSCSQEE
jgi:hypothetical protein